MAFLHNDVLDNGLQVLSNATSTEVVLCSQEPTSRTEAVTTYNLGSKSAPSIAAPSDRVGGGREVIMAAFTDGAVTASGTNTATHWALVDGTRLLAANTIGNSQPVTGGNTWELDQQSIGIPAP